MSRLFWIDATYATPPADERRQRNVEMVMTRALIVASVAFALATPTVLQAADSGARPQTRPVPVQTHRTQHKRMPGMNKTPDVTLKRGATAN